MGHNWKTTKLLDHYDIRSGLSKPAKDFGSGYPFLTFKDVFYNYFTPDILGDLVQSNDKEQASSSVKCGDVFLTRTSETMHELGMSCVALQDYENSTFNGFCKRLRPHKESELVPEYVGYYLRSPKFRQSMLAFSTMSTRASLNNEMIGRLEISYPSKNEQLKIAKILKTLDDKVAINRQINKTLEQMAQALFKSWFVDFDPVVDNALDTGFFEQDLDLPNELLRRAEARKAVRAQAGFKPLPAATRQLFPATFEPCDEPSLGLGGWVPKEWDIHAISDIAFINKDSLTKKNAPKKIKYVDLSNAKDGIILGIQEYSFEEAPSRARRVLKKRDTIFGMVRPANRSFAYVDRDGLTGSTGFVVISAKNKNTSSFIYQKLTSDGVVEDLIRIADGAAYPAIKPDDISELMTVVPNKYILDLFEKTIDGYRERVAHNLNNNEQLANLRDTLLPKLISGELSLDEFELTSQQGAGVTVRTVASPCQPGDKLSDSPNPVMDNHHL